ncbi:oligoendopeptidase F [Effusibacillus lacus]|uniref:Oligopeptidase F n=1 Tax=Effusibacillus lacus TaxID=1348429 RepID=A0A292YS41_9BACL|nr:oligoendopeptidase F [Effusibacillus lacus]TCS76903.1 oligopeptidase F [Effusibacillus lacus]GAX91234.1 oligoendopeptidase F [Effusibacillus lacus]
MSDAAAIKRLPKRNEIPDEMKWKLEDLYASTEEWERDFEEIRNLVVKIRGFEGKVGESAHNLLDCLKTQDQLSEKMGRLYAFARMRRDEDNTNAVYQALTDRAATLSVQASSATAFIIPEILDIPAETLEQYMQQESGLALYRFALQEILRTKEHILSPAEEQLLAETGELAHAPGTIFGMLNNADIKFPFIVDENGQEVELTKGSYIQFLESKDRRVRKDAFEALYATYSKQKNTLAAILHASIKKDAFYARVRKYESARHAALDSDNIPIEVYDNLIQAVHEYLPEMYRYVRLRKKLLGVEDLHMYDLFAPIVKDVEFKIPYEKAKDMVAKGLAPLGEEYGRILQEGFTAGWIDVFENEGKTSGAYSWGPYGAHPFVLMNWQDNMNNMFTLAHEMGHAIHSYYTNTTQPYTYSDYTIFVAEVASTCNEALVLHHLLETTTDPRERMYLINHQLEAFRGTVFRQTMFAEFEKITHEKVEAGEPLTPELLCEVYRELNLKYYGPDMVVDEQIDMEWARVPHFYNAFYVYKYATGFSAATALSQQILKEGKPAVERYINFLKSGSSDSSINLLKNAGVDMTSPKPVRDALEVFKKLLDEMEQLADRA